MPCVVVIDGVIGAGKTTAIEALREELSNRNLRVVVVPEPVANWVEVGILGSFYSDMKRWSYSFQTYAFCSRIKLLRDSMLNATDVDIFIVERFPMTDRAFAECLYSAGEMTDMEYSMYLEWIDVWSQLVPLPINRIVHLRTPIRVCMERIQQRGREAEMNVTEQYQESLLEKYDAVLLSSEVGVLTVSTPLNLESESGKREFCSLVIDGLL